MQAVFRWDFWSVRWACKMPVEGIATLSVVSQIQWALSSQDIAFQGQLELCLDTIYSSSAGSQESKRPSVGFRPVQLVSLHLSSW